MSDLSTFAKASVDKANKISGIELLMTRRGVRVAERASLESLCTAMYRGFESRPLRNPEADPAKRGHASGFCRLINSRSNRMKTQKQIPLVAGTLLGFVV